MILRSLSGKNVQMIYKCCKLDSNLHYIIEPEMGEL